MSRLKNSKFFFNLIKNFNAYYYTLTKFHFPYIFFFQSTNHLTFKPKYSAPEIKSKINSPPLYLYPPSKKTPGGRKRRGPKKRAREAKSRGEIQQHRAGAVRRAVHLFFATDTPVCKPQTPDSPETPAIKKVKKTRPALNNRTPQVLTNTHAHAGDSGNSLI